MPDYATNHPEHAECTCEHPRIWHSTDLSRCEFHCGNPERCPCSGYNPKEGS